MKNTLVADIFRGIAELLELKGDNPFRIRAYLRAARAIENLNKAIEESVSSDALNEIPGVGQDLAAKIKEIVATGTCGHYEELKKIFPDGVIEMLSVPSLGPKTVRLFYNRLKLVSLDQLKKAAEDGRLLTLPGIKEKTVLNILKGISLVRRGRERMDLFEAWTGAESIIGDLEKLKEVDRIVAAGSLRRMKETVRDLDILVVSDDPLAVSGAFVSLPQVKSVLSKGETKSSVLIQNDVQVDLRVLDADSFGAALVYFTGSKDHNIRLRSLALKKGWKINEYGVFDKKDRCLASKTEEDVYRALGLDYISPEMREDAGEIEAALDHKLPLLIEAGDIRGDFHVHTNYSDGTDTIETMAREAKRLGYEYIFLTDHSESLKVAHGLDLKRLKQKKAALDKVNKKMKGFSVLFGTEAEIDSDGNIDYGDDVLSGFDLVVAAIHSGFKQSQKKLTQRIVKACRNKFVHIIAHPTGRLWPMREAYDIDLKEIFKVARDTNTAFEINAHPSRLDLCDAHARWARDSGVKLAIGTDSHDVRHLSYMKFGVGLGRRAWLKKGDCLNTLKLNALLKYIRKN